MSRDEITNLNSRLNDIKNLVENNIQQHSAHYSDIVKHLQDQDDKHEALVKKVDAITGRLNQLNPVSTGVSFFRKTRDFAVFISPYGIFLAVISWLWKMTLGK